MAILGWGKVLILTMWLDLRRDLVLADSLDPPSAASATSRRLPVLSFSSGVDGRVFLSELRRGEH